MKSIKNILTIGCIYFFSCTQRSDETTEQMSSVDIVQQINSKFRSVHLYKELLKRSLNEKSSNKTKDTIPSYAGYDTIMPVNISKALSQYSTKDLVTAYFDILEERKVIYGIDNRKQIDSNLRPEYLNSARQVVGLIDKHQLQQRRLISKGEFKTYYSLCGNETFSNEPLFADCTGFACAKNKVMSAGHCVDKNNFRNYYLVFDLTIERISEFKSGAGIPSDLVYEIDNVIESKIGDADYSIFTVNKQIPADRIAKLSNKAIYSPKDSFYVIGFPCGLSMKIADQASLRTDNRKFFVINSDTYGGNSGSPVFNEKTHMVEGILVRGNRDFPLNFDNCRYSVKCESNGCRGEDVTKIKPLKNKIL